MMPPTKKNGVMLFMTIRRTQDEFGNLRKQRRQNRISKIRSLSLLGDSFNSNITECRIFFQEQTNHTTAMKYRSRLTLLLNII